MKRFFAVIAILGAVLVATPACAPLAVPLAQPNYSSATGVHVRLMRTMFGDAATPGIDEIGALVAKIPGVTLVQLYEYYQTQQVANDIMADPLAVQQVLVGGSCGANSVTVVAAAVPRTIVGMFSIQESQWCGGVPISSNVLWAQETYDPNCLDTAGLGCKEYVAAAGEPPGRITIIVRPECHPCSFVDPDAQNDIVLAVKSVTGAKASSKFGGPRGVGKAVNVVVLHRGQHL